MNGEAQSEGVPGLVPRRLASGVAAIIATALLVFGAMLPWVSGPHGTKIAHGVSIDIHGHGVIGSRAGLQGGDGIVFILIGLPVALIALQLLKVQLRRWHRPALVACFACATGWTWLDVREMGSVSTSRTAEISLSPGIGVIVTGIGLLALIVAALAVPFPLEGDGERLYRRGRFADALEIDQATYRRLVRNHADEKTLWWALFHVFAEQGNLGLAEAARQNGTLLADTIESTFTASPEEALAPRMLVADGFTAIDVPAGRRYAAWALSQARATLPNEHPGIAETAKWIEELEADL
jgi:hypothetical protein